MQKDNSFINWCKANNKIILLQEYMPSNPIPMEKITFGSSKRVSWKCSLCGNIWKSTVSNRTSLNRGCPVCGKRKAADKLRSSRALKNNLLEHHPELSLEWDNDRNELQPKDYACGSDYYAHWICSWCGEHWQTQIKKRALRGDGCPKCRKQHTSFREQTLFYYCRKAFPEAKNRDNRFGFELDIYIPEIQTAIEYDGMTWHKTTSVLARDNKKDEYCNKNGITLFRFRDYTLPKTNSAHIINFNENSISDFTTALEYLLFSILKVDPFIIDIKNDTVSIISLYENNKRENSIAVKYPEITKEWHYEKNGILSPQLIPPGYGKSIWWKCSECGFEYKMTPNHRTGRGSGCPKCSPSKVASANSVKVKNMDTGMIYNSLKDAAKAYNGSKSVICECCKGITKIAYGCRWCYVNQNELRRPHKKCKIRCIEKDIIFDNDKAAALWCNGDNRNINAVCNGRCKTYRGYHWEYYEE